MNNREKNLEILALRHQLALLQRQTGKPQLTWPDRALLAALLHRIPRGRLRQLHLIVSPDSVLRWHRELLRRRHAKASRPKRPGRPRTVRSIRILVLRLVRENPSWGYRRVHGELAALGIKVAASTVWSILKDQGIPPASDRQHTTWATFLRSQAEAILAADFFETKTLTGATLTVLAVIEHATRRVRILGTTTQPTAAWVTQLARNLVMDIQDSETGIKYLIRDRDVRYPTSFDSVLADQGVEVVQTGVKMPRMNAIMERWIRSCRAELLDRTLIWDRAHLMYALREYEQFHNEHRPHRALASAAPLRPLPEPLGSDQITHLDVRRHDRLRGILHEYQNAA
ncbi:Integrase core domain-containing protein [Streptomyces sp. DvalAA-14]|nr:MULTISPECIES: integrase core domain-containing protein [unclassified Streptomyces]MYS25066.1 transposase [Streptomyces sp. SID4948]SCE51809.1 Integrase core domain-containing protein [Streptomyces sp. DvalAA-14]